MSQGTVYLIHFDRPIGNPENPRGQAQHYIGWTDSLQERLRSHSRGRGAAILAFLSQVGIGWNLARVWEGSRQLERRLKNRKKARQLCPICQGLGGLVGSHSTTNER